MKKKNNKIVLGTSLAPFNFEKQIKAINSWLENGFRIISCNSKEEIEILLKEYVDIPIEFVEIKRNAESIIGKKLPFIQDILEEASNRAEEVCGFINADIILSHMPSGMDVFIRQEVQKSIIIVHRNEINCLENIESLNWDLHFDGIDLFFLDRSLVRGFFNDGFYVQSVWDLCILIKCKILKIQIKELVNPIAFHEKHAIQWNFENSNLLVQKFMKKYFVQKEISYKKALDLYYNILYEDCRQICFCQNKEYHCLFLLDRKSNTTVKSITKQDYKNIEIGYSEEEKVKADIVFYIKGDLKFSEVFCKAVIYIIEQFKCTSLEIGRFFISSKSEKYFYNELNRNINTIKQINQDCSVYTLVTCNDKTLKKKYGMFYYPLIYEKLNLFDDSISRNICITEKTYIMPAGNRAMEWYNNYRNYINFEIAGYLDNNKEGNDTLGMKIYPVDIIKKEKENVFVIVASKYYYGEIVEQLRKIIKNDRILNAGFMIAIKDNIICYFDIEKYKERWSRIE